MSQPQQMNMGGMGGMGGPVGGAGNPMQQQQNIGTPNSTAGLNGTDYIKRLNTAIYDYLLRNQLYDVARSFIGKMEIEADIKKSPGQGGNQANGADNMDIDSKEIRDRPDDLPAPAQLGDGPFLQDWWCQFWELYHGHRGKGKQNTLNYIGAQRQAQKARNGVMGNMGMGMMPQMNNGMMQPDLKRAAMQQNQQRNMTPQQAAQMQNLQANKQNAMIQGANMERQGSQMDMSGQRTGSPNSGDAPSPKRPRIDGGNMQQMNQQRPGGPQGQMQGNPSVETYSQSIGQSMKAAMTQANSNVNKGMPPNAQMGPGGQQGSPMSQAGMDGATGEFYAAAAANGRMGNMPNANAATGNQAGAGSGNHALQDYQMQLMLLEQQNKKRLLMARQEQDSMSQPGQVGPNGQFGGTGMSPQGSRQGDPSPNPNDMQRGTPKIGKNGMSPNGDLAGRGSPQPGTMMNPQMPQDLQRQMAMQNGGAMMRPPSSHPMAQLTPDQMRMYQQQQQQMMQNGGWQQGQPPPGQMMPGQQPGMPGGPQGQGPPNMTPRQANQQMPPPPAPASGTQPSSPQQPAAPPTPNQTAKPKPGTKKETAKKAANKKGAAANATPATESEQPPTPTPAAPMTPMNQNFQNQNKNMPNGQPQPNQQNNNNNQANNNNNAVQAPNQQPDMSQPFGSLGDDQFGMNLEFADLQGGDVLDNFDFDSFLNTNDGDAGFGFDANLAFGDGSIEAGGDLGGN